MNNFKYADHLRVHSVDQVHREVTEERCTEKAKRLAWVKYMLSCCKQFIDFEYFQVLGLTSVGHMKLVMGAGVARK